MDLYNIVVSLIGTLPTELAFIYGIITLIFASIIIMLPFAPFIVIYKLVK